MIKHVHVVGYIAQYFGLHILLSWSKQVKCMPALKAILDPQCKHEVQQQHLLCVADLFAAGGASEQVSIPATPGQTHCASLFSRKEK